MHSWHASYDPKTLGHKHSVAPGFGHALFAPIAVSVFKILRISAAVWEHDQEWLPIHGEPQQLFEFEHGKEADRAIYNTGCLERARAEAQTVRGEFAGYSDFFVPISSHGNVVAVLVVGSFLREPLSSAGIQERWRALTGQKGHPSDPEFAAYLSHITSILVLADDKARALKRLLECLASLMAGEGPADELMNEIEVLRAELEKARFVERVWDVMRDVVDDLSKRHPQSGPRGELLRDFGLKKIADHVLVGLIVNRSAASDPVDELLRRDAFQRRAVELGRASGHAVAGRVGDHGVVFLSGSGGSATSQKRKVRELAEKALSLGKRLGLALHFGSSAAPASLPMAQSYHAALGAAESALAHGAELVAAKLEARRSAPSLQSLRRELGVAVEERPELFSARFERYLDAVAVECAYRVEPARVHLEIGFERVTEALADSGVLDAKSLRVMSEELSRTTRGSLDISDLFAAYRRAVFDVSQAAREPAPAHRDRNLRGAIEYMQQHYAETLGRDQVARIAGFAPGYFSELFKEREGVSFEQYLSGLRIERAKQLLHGTDLDAKRVAKLSGFKSPDYFAHAFRRATGITPLAFRRSHRTVPRAPGSPGRLSD